MDGSVYFSTAKLFLAYIQSVVVELEYSDRSRELAPDWRVPFLVGEFLS